MIRELTRPSAERARELLRELGQDERLVGLRMSGMGGSSPVPIYNLAAAANFMRTPSPQELMDAYSNATVGYLDLATLKTWLADVHRDEELAAAIQELIDTGEGYAFIAPEIQELLLTRVAQCREAAEDDVSEG